MNWHRLFGLLLTDFFTGSPFVVELEKDLSSKKQVLDVVILRKQSGGCTGRLADGCNHPAINNLLIFKSHCKAADGRSITNSHRPIRARCYIRSSRALTEKVWLWLILSMIFARSM